MEVWTSGRKTEGEAEIGGNYAFRMKQAECCDFDPREDQIVSWFMWGTRNCDEYESEHAGLSDLIDLIWRKEKEAGIPEAKSCFAEHLENGDDNPACVCEEDARRGDIENLFNAAKNLGIMIEPVFLYDHGGRTFSIRENSMWGGWDASVVGIVWSANHDDAEQFRKNAQEECAELTDWAEGFVYDLERAPVDPETGELLGEWVKIDPGDGEPLDEYSDAPVIGERFAREALKSCAEEAAKDAARDKAEQKQGPKLG